MVCLEQLLALHLEIEQQVLFILPSSWRSGVCGRTAEALLLLNSKMLFDLTEKCGGTVLVPFEDCSIGSGIINVVE
jgi:hypothetical protein